MLRHVTIGTGDLERAKSFYDAVIATLRIRCEVPSALWSHDHPDDDGAHRRDLDGYKIACACHLPAS